MSGGDISSGMELPTKLDCPQMYGLREFPMWNNFSWGAVPGEPQGNFWFWHVLPWRKGRDIRMAHLSFTGLWIHPQTPSDPLRSSPRTNRPRMAGRASLCSPGSDRARPARKCALNADPGSPALSSPRNKLEFPEIQIQIWNSSGISPCACNLKRGKKSSQPAVGLSIWNSSLLIHNVNTGVNALLSEICSCAPKIIVICAQPWERDELTGCQLGPLPFPV